MLFSALKSSIYDFTERKQETQNKLELQKRDNFLLLLILLLLHLVHFRIPFPVPQKMPMLKKNDEFYFSSFIFCRKRERKKRRKKIFVLNLIRFDISEGVFSLGNCLPEIQSKTWVFLNAKWIVNETHTHTKKEKNEGARE